MNGASIEVVDFHKSYRLGLEHRMRRVEAVRGISFTVPPGSLYGFIGPNGAGKSTTIKAIVGLLRPTSGTLRLAGGNPLQPSIRRHLGYSPEHAWFPEQLSGRELIEGYGRLSGLRGRNLSRAVEEACALCQVESGWLSRRIRTYSKGMAQRLSLAQAVVHSPEVVVLDEPMSGLDPMGRRDIRQAILELHRRGATVFYSSHVLSDVEEICTHAAILVRGTLRREGTLESLLDDPADPGHRRRLEDILAVEVDLE